MTTLYSDGVFYEKNVRINPFLALCVDSLNCGIAIDFGCGVGTNALYLQERGWNVWAVERESIAVSEARTRISSQQVFQDDIREFDFSLLPDYSLITCNYVLQHFSVEEATIFLKKSIDKLSVGGHLILSIFERENAIDEVALKKLLKELSCDLLQEKHWSRWDYDHGPAHFHRGYESFWIKVSK